MGLRIQLGFLAAHVSANGHKLHFGRNDALPGIVHLGNIFAGRGAARLAFQPVERNAAGILPLAIVAGLKAARLVGFGIGRRHP